ncbi:MAG TPA: hypothetical protein VFA09_17850 [Ktedonobacteraceae bacterium]|nr:hypothetical protein [Ktedonobacteraceae bacterium]
MTNELINRPLRLRGRLIVPSADLSVPTSNNEIEQLIPAMDASR